MFFLPIIHIFVIQKNLIILQTTEYLTFAQNPELQKAVNTNLHLQVGDFVLKFGKFDWVKVAAAQLEAKQKLSKKIPFLSEFPEWIFPPSLAFEQASSWQTALYKSQFAKDKLVADVTGGMGIDCFAFAQVAKKVIYVEQNELLCEIFKHNISIANIKNIEIVNANAEDFLQNYDGVLDLIYLDPARRIEGQKVVEIADCEPDILKLQPILLKKSKEVLVKLSPMLSLDLPIEIKENCQSISVINVEKECKEVVIHLKAAAKSDNVNVIHLPENLAFNFSINDEKNASCAFSLPKQFLYEPSPAMLKAGPYKTIANHFNINKLLPNSHLYTSQILVPHFLGRSFKIKEVIAFEKKNIKKFDYQKANISVRNFPYKAEELKKMLKIKDGGEIYIFGTTILDGSLQLIVCEKV